MALQSPLVYGRVLASQIRQAIPNLLRLENQRSVACSNSRRYTKLITAYCGFSKNLLPSKKNRSFGEDAFFITEDKVRNVLGVADGVGGWRNYGIDPSLFSSALMENCKNLIEQGLLNDPSPIEIMKEGYHEIFENKEPLFGSTTACIAVLDKKNSLLHSANLGDSGFLVIRKQSVIHSSMGQQHYFNTPYQLAIPPPECEGNVIQDDLESAEERCFPVEEGDVVVMATDGLFDNLTESQILDEISKLKDHQLCSVQSVADSLANLASSLSYDPNYFSPFAKQAKEEEGIEAVGGKPDDITVLVAIVCLAATPV
ncbi:protein phosphatase PTC7 homolog [Xenia sp. Carnegie-2017]|uniref:protein phosphatase PTC7 homolog n=1 Tax=Xenia sp. Carnegie-2017 TaxID=2897299 RepID=UPI001F04E8A1|nr:protein phosphatase PTC7 homolog [Xenia sp. Carnegie-2017]